LLYPPTEFLACGIREMPWIPAYKVRNGLMCGQVPRRLSQSAYRFLQVRMFNVLLQWELKRSSFIPCSRKNYDGRHFSYGPPLRQPSSPAKESFISDWRKLGHMLHMQCLQTRSSSARICGFSTLCIALGFPCKFWTLAKFLGISGLPTHVMRT